MLGLFLILTWKSQVVSGCSYPAIPAHCSLALNLSELVTGSIAKYNCDSGYELIGTNHRTCMEDGQWSDEAPICAVNVALGKPSRQSSIDGRGMPEAAVDGRPARLPFFDNCARTKMESSPWWFTNLLDHQEIRNVQITFGASCCGEEPAILEIRIGDNMDVHQNPLCISYSEKIDLGQIVTLKCEKPLKGTFLSIRLKNVNPNVLSLCEVAAYSITAIPRNNCPVFPKDNTHHIGSFNGNCYTLYNNYTLSWSEAQNHCRERNGELIHGSSPGLQGFISWEISKTKQDGNGITNYWMGLIKNSESGQWIWLNNQSTAYTFWAVPLNNDIGGDNNKNCASFNGNAGWLWADTECDRRLNWICQFEPIICGNPDRLENTTVTYNSTVQGQVAYYECPTDQILQGTQTRTCLNSGKWSGSSPYCAHVDCGQPKDIANGTIYLRNGNTEFNSVVEYSCKEGYILSGILQSTCQSTGLWSEISPVCEAVACPTLAAFDNGRFIVNRNGENISITYVCNQNYILEGNPTRRCLPNKFWEGLPPRCFLAETVTTTQNTFPTGRVEFLPVDHLEAEFNSSYVFNSNQNNSLPSLHSNSGDSPEVDIAGVMDLDFNKKRREKNTEGYIAIGVICGIALIVAVVVIIVFCICRRSRKNSSKESGTGDVTDMSSFDSSSSDSDSNRLFHYYKRAWENLRLEQEKHSKNNFEVLRTSPRTSEPSSDTWPKSMVTLDVKREKGPLHFFGAGKGTVEHLRDSGEIIINPDVQAMFGNSKDKKMRAQKATLDRYPNISNPEGIYQNDRPFSTFKHQGYP